MLRDFLKNFFVITFLIFLLLASPVAWAINVQEELAKYPAIAPFIRQAGDLENVSVEEPLVIVGSDADFLEKNVLTQLLGMLKNGSNVGSL